MSDLISCFCCCRTATCLVLKSVGLNISVNVGRAMIHTLLWTMSQSAGLNMRKNVKLYRVDMSRKRSAKNGPGTLMINLSVPPNLLHDIQRDFRALRTRAHNLAVSLLAFQNSSWLTNDEAWIIVYSNDPKKNPSCT